MADEKVFDKFQHRRIDPVSLKAYDTRKVTDEAMAARLVQSPNETEAHVKKSLEEHRMIISYMLEEKASQLARMITVNTD